MAMSGLLVLLAGVVGCAVLIIAAVAVAYVIAQERDARKNRD